MINDLSYIAYCERFGTEQACIDTMFQFRWPNGFRCPSCRHPHYYLITSRRLPLYQCCSCGRQTSIIAGTVLEGSRTPLTTWFKAIYLLALPSGISATQLCQIIEVTYKTAWLIAHKIRNAMQQDDAFVQLSHVVRVDKVHYGSAYYRDARHPLLIGGTLDDHDNPVYVKIKQPDPSDVRTETRSINSSGIQAFIEKNVVPMSVTHVQRGPRHPILNQIILKTCRWLNDTFHGIGAKHLQSYLDEFCYRLNLTLKNLQVQMPLIRICSMYRKITYKELIRKRSVLVVPWATWESKSKWKGHHLSLWRA